MDKESFYVIQYWMIKELKLTGLEKDVYAIIYGFTQNGRGVYDGSLQYLADFTGSTKRGIQKALQKLLDKKFLKKTNIFKDNQKFCTYSALRPIEQSSTPIEQSSTPIEQSSTPIEQSSTDYRTEFHAPIEQSSTNNIYIKYLKDRDNIEPISPTFEKMSEEEKQWTLENYPNKEFAKQIFEIFKKGALPCANENEINFLMRDFKNGMQKIKSNYSYLTHNEILEACRNYAATVNNPYCYLTTKLNFERFIEMKNFQDFLPANFVFDNFVRFDKKKEVEEEKQQSQEESKSYELCPICQTKKMYWNQDFQMFACETCKKYYKFQYIDDERVKRGL